MTDLSKAVERLTVYADDPMRMSLAYQAEMLRSDLRTLLTALSAKDAELAKAKADTLWGISGFVNETTGDICIGPWRIYHYAPPIPVRNCDWHFVHESYDGADDGPTDPRAGHAASPAACLYEVMQLGEEAADALMQARLDLRRMKDAKDEAEAELAAAREALGPFAEKYDRRVAGHGQERDAKQIEHRLGDFRQARLTLGEDQ